MLNVEQLREESEKAFVAAVQEKVQWLAEDCWPSNLKHYLMELNEIIVASIKMGVSTATIFSKEEIDELVADLTPLRTLGMKKVARAHLISALAKKGIDPQLFEKKLEDTN